MEITFGNQDPAGGCFPSWGVISISGSADNEALDFTGALCLFLGSFNFNGGFGLDHASDMFSSIQSRSMTAKAVPAGSENFQFKLKGKACKGGTC